MPGNISAQNHTVPRNILGSITCANISTSATTTVALNTARTIDVPTGLAVAKTGSGATTWGYKVSALSLAHAETAVSSEVTVASQANTLSSSVYNTISWYPSPGAGGYRIYRTTYGTSPGTAGLIGEVAADILALEDKALAVNGVAAGPTSDATYLSLAQGVNHITIYNTGSYDLVYYFPPGNAYNATTAAAVANVHLTASVTDATFTKRLVCKTNQYRTYDFTNAIQWICLRSLVGAGSCVIEVG
jgi:hypothetical protein